MITRDRVVTAVTGTAGLFFLAFGLWAFVAPSSFYDQIALFPPHNRHFLHDAGAFQIGLGATLLLALRWRDALFVALLGVGTGAAVHAVAHLLDRNLGGRRTDPVSLAIIAVVIVLAALLRWNPSGRERSDGSVDAPTRVRRPGSQNKGATDAGPGAHPAATAGDPDRRGRL